MPYQDHQLAICNGGSVTAIVMGMTSHVFAVIDNQAASTASTVALIVAVGGLLSTVLTNVNVAWKNYLESKVERHNLRNLLQAALLKVSLLESRVDSNTDHIGKLETVNLPNPGTPESGTTRG